MMTTIVSNLSLWANDISFSTKHIDVSFSAVWIFANLTYAGMRAQGKGSTLWRVISFVCGFPGTLLTLLLVQEGSERAYGVDLPAKR